MLKKSLIFLSLGLIVLCAFPLLSFQAGKSKYYELSGSLALTRPKPEVFRNWHFAGSAVIPDEKNSNKAIFPGIHHVYIDPSSYKHHQEKGTFPDSTIIVMENLHIETRESVGGFGYFTTGGQDILVAIKDRRAYRGNGWGYYLFRDKDIKNGKANAMPEDSRCTSCHQAAAEEDEVFTQYYPDLRQKK